MPVKEQGFTWQRNTSHRHRSAHHYFEYETTSTNMGWSEHVAASACTDRRGSYKAEKVWTVSFPYFAMCSLITLSFTCDSFLRKTGWLSWLFSIAFMMGFFCTELAGFVLLEKWIITVLLSVVYWYLPIPIYNNW